jgi:malate dehydrogenase (oxaloacetate-decarboxylating)(NADP+)
LSVVPTKSMVSADDLALAYSPGVAEPVRRIADHPEDAYRYTNRGNLVAVVTNGTAILGLGNRGALASKPVMEGKAALFKKFANIDAFDLEINSEDPEDIIRTVALLEPTFGGINLEDIRAPECFVIEEALIDRLRIPVFHDDQHGTAVVVCAGLLNALHIAGKEIGSVAIVLNGAGAAGIAVGKMLLSAGADPERILLCDSRGVVTTDRTDLNAYKQLFARHTDRRTLADALRGADVCIGVSKADVMKGEMLRSMERDPVVFALANPDPEIEPALARQVRPDVILATGRSDQPNQVNNVLCFPFLFRGALDARATVINEPMKLAAMHALAGLAREPVLPEVTEAYGLPSLSFGRAYLLPKPFDPRLLSTVSSAVAQAATESGVVRAGS